MNYSLIIPIYNEESTLPTLLKKLKELTNNIEIIIIDDGSDDNTNSILNKDKNFIHLRNKNNKGKGFAIKRGVEAANNEYIILMDGDLEIDFECIPRLINRFENNNYDVLVGIRWNKLSNYKYDINTLGNYFINGLFNIIYNTRLNDVLCCTKILNKNVIKSLDIQSNGFSIEIETMAKLILNDFTIDQLHINYNRRSIEDGKKLKLSDGWGIIGKMITIRLFNK